MVLLYQSYYKKSSRRQKKPSEHWLTIPLTSGSKNKCVLFIISNKIKNSTLRANCFLLVNFVSRMIYSIKLFNIEWY